MSPSIHPSIHTSIVSKQSTCIYQRCVLERINYTFQDRRKFFFHIHMLLYHVKLEYDKLYNHIFSKVKNIRYLSHLKYNNSRM